jgi:hypothetical protein
MDDWVCDSKRGLERPAAEVAMRTAFLAGPNRWKTLYRAAILETNKALLYQRVKEAEAAVKARGREVFCGDGTLEETEALEDALYTLRAFKSAWQHREARLPQQ